MYAVGVNCALRYRMHDVGLYPTGWGYWLVGDYHARLIVWNGVEIYYGE